MFFKKNFVFLLILLFPINLFANQFEKNIEKLGLTLSGHYIDETMKNENGKYVLPSRDWMKKNVNNDRAIFYREGAFFGDFDGNGRLDYITWGTGKPCQEGQKSKEGRVGCGTINTNLLPYQIYSVDEFLNFKKLNNKDVFEWGASNDNGYPNGTSRIIIQDFNDDGIDDFFIANAAVELNNGKFNYKGVNPVLVSIGPFKWIASRHTGHLVDKKTSTFQGFSHGSDAGDIDNESLADFNNDGILDIVAGNAHFNAEYRKQSPQGNVVKETKNSHFIALYYGNTKGKFKQSHILEPARVGNFVFSEAPEMTAFDFDNDGDLDLVSSTVGMYYSGSAWVAYENINGKLKIADTNIIIQPLDEWQDAKIWGSMVQSESNPWNTYCSKSILIDVNNDGLMDLLCDNAVQHHRMTNHFLINKGNMQFDFATPEQVSNLVEWLE